MAQMTITAARMYYIDAEHSLVNQVPSAPEILLIDTTHASSTSITVNKCLARDRATYRFTRSLAPSVTGVSMVAMASVSRPLNRCQEAISKPLSSPHSSKLFVAGIAPNKVGQSSLLNPGASTDRPPNYHEPRPADERGERIHFASRALGIFKPRQMTAALSIKTVMPRAGRPIWYRDQRADLDVETGLLPYDLARKSANHTNDALKLAHQRRAPLTYFRAVRSTLYEAVWPVWVEDFRADEGRVLLAAANPAREDAVADEWPRPDTSSADRERSYSLRMTRRRNHQAWFSKHVRSVYGYRCAFSP